MLDKLEGVQKGYKLTPKKQMGVLSYDSSKIDLKTICEAIKKGTHYEASEKKS